MNETVDIRLIAACLANQRKAQRQLYELSLPRLNMICRRYLVNPADLQDALQDVFTSIFHHLDQFDVRRASFKTWTNRIAINACLKKNEGNRRGRTIQFSDREPEPRIAPEVLQQLSNQDMILWLRRMPRPYYEVFSLFAIDGFTHQEIADLLQISVALSRQRLARARTWLKQRLPEDLRPAITANKERHKGLAMVPIVLYLSLFLEKASLEFLNASC